MATATTFMVRAKRYSPEIVGALKTVKLKIRDVRNIARKVV